MKWGKRGEYLAFTNTFPEYRVARFADGRFDTYRASFKGEFIGTPTDDPKEAQRICERHHQITQEAKEVTSGQEERAARPEC